MNAHFYSHPKAEMKGFSRLCQTQDFHGVHLSIGQYIREELGGNIEEVIWLSHPGVRCQTWHSSFSNYYNMLNLLSSPPGRKVFQKKEPDLHFSCMLWIQKKLFKPWWGGVNWNSNSPLLLTPVACYKRQTFNLSLQGFPAINQVTRVKRCIHERLYQIKWEWRGTNCHRREICNFFSWNSY